METITQAEIAKLLGITRDNLRQRMRRNNWAMPHPVGKDRNFLLYDRKAVMVWIENYQIGNVQPEVVSSGLDNRLARQFLTRRAYAPIDSHSASLTAGAQGKPKA